MERTVLLERGDEIRPEHLQLGPGTGPGARREAQSIGAVLDAILVSPDLPSEGIEFEKLVEEIERQLILKAYHLSEENQSKTAEALNMKRDKLRYRMKLYEIHPEGGPLAQTGTDGE